MSLSDADALPLLEQFSFRSNWRNHYGPESFDWISLNRDRRLGVSRSEFGTSVTRSRDGETTIIADLHGHTTTIRKLQDNALVVSNGHGKSFTLDNSRRILRAEKDFDISTERARDSIPQGSKAFIDSEGIMAMFDDQITRLLFLDAGILISFSNPRHSKHQAEYGRLFHDILLGKPEKSSASANLADVAQRVVAWDMGIEPRRKVEKTARSLTAVDIAAQASSSSHHLMPKFMIVAGDGNEIFLRTSLEIREMIIRHASFLAPLVKEAENFRPAHDSATEPFSLIQLLQDGHSMNTADAGWKFSFVDTFSTDKFIHSARHIMRFNLKLDPNNFITAEVKPGQALIAMDQKSLEKCVNGLQASMEMMDAIENGLPARADAESFITERLQAGAEPLYLNSNSFDNRDTWERLAMLAGNCTMLEVFRRAHVERPDMGAGPFAHLV